MRLAQKPVPYSQLMARTVTRELKRIGRRSCSSLLCMEVKLHLQLWQEEGGDPSDYDERDEDSILSLSQYLLPTHCLERIAVQRNPWPMGPWWLGSSSSPEPCGIGPACSALVVDRNLKYHNKNICVVLRTLCRNLNPFEYQRDGSECLIHSFSSMVD